MIVRRTSVEPFDFGGIQILDYTAGHEAGSSFAMVEVPPGGRHQEAYSQRSEKYYYVVAGQVAFSINGEEHILMAGDLCVVEQGQRFSYVNSTQDAAQLLLVHTPTFQLESEAFVG